MGLVSAGVVEDDQNVASTHAIDVDYAYPVPTLGRDRALAVIQPWLMERDIFSRGRFGSWRYEMGNMDHAVKMGIDVARRIVEDRPGGAVVARDGPVGRRARLQRERCDREARRRSRTSGRGPHCPLSR